MSIRFICFIFNLIFLNFVFSAPLINFNNLNNNNNNNNNNPDYENYDYDYNYGEEPPNLTPTNTFAEVFRPIMTTMRNRTGTTLQNGLQVTSYGLKAVNSAIQGVFDINQSFITSANTLIQSWFGRNS